ncbi:MAG: hypothetical protein OQK25_07240 [Gammaproteobacteria bacterium]|nr:hypothetical protein [Gammaproteobacteria bacterium]
MLPRKLNHLCLILTTFVLLCVSTAALSSSKQVVFIRYKIAPTYFQTVVDNFKDAMTLRGYVEGRDINYIDIITSTADRASVPEVIAAVNKYKESADMFITSGWISMYARKELKETDVPQLFVPVLRSVALKMVKDTESEPGTNISGVYLMYPPEKILRISKFIIPSIERYAYVYDSNIPADIIFKTAYESLSVKDRHGINIHYFDLAQGVDKVLEQLNEHRIEAYGGIVGSFKNRERLAESNIPVITSFTLDIDEQSIKQYVENDNIVAGLFNSFGYCGSLAAEMTADIFDGIKKIQQTIPINSKQIAFLNLKGARKLNLPISFDVLEAVDLIVK